MHSMTAYGSASGSLPDARWDWDLRAVNGRGLDIKLRLPEALGALEPGLRKSISARLSRGTLTATLRVGREGSVAMDVDETALSAHLARIRGIEAMAEASGTRLAPLGVGDVLALPGVAGTEKGDTAALEAAVRAGFDAALDALVAMRAREGAVLALVLGELVDAVAAACDRAVAMAPERTAHQKRALADALARTADAGEMPDDDRIAHEIALIAVRGDVTEELERLRIHVDAARALMAADEPVGRRLDFLTQEFNREANTLCSKAQYGPLTQIGLDLKAAIDQIREQVQNVE